MQTLPSESKGGLECVLMIPGPFRTLHLQPTGSQLEFLVKIVRILRKSSTRRIATLDFCVFAAAFCAGDAQMQELMKQMGYEDPMQAQAQGVSGWLHSRVRADNFQFVELVRPGLGPKTYPDASGSLRCRWARAQSAMCCRNKKLHCCCFMCR